MTHNSDRSAPSLLKAKIQPPDLRIKIAREQSLLSLLESALQYPITFVEAPAGYGKTVLLKYWYDAVLKNEDRAIWLFLDEEDTAETILHYLLFAVGDEQTDTQNINADGAHHQGLFQFLSRLEADAETVYIFLDDLERVTDQSALQLLDVLVDRLPQNVKLIMAGRQNPGIDLVPSELNGLILSLSIDHLKFRARDYAGFFEDDISQALIEDIDQKTEGWGAALQMLKIALAKKGDQSFKDILHDFSGQSRLPSQYIANQIYMLLPKDLKNYLKRLSAIEWFDQHIADQMTGGGYDLQLLTKDPKLIGFLYTSDQEGGALRMHALLREYCLQQLKNDSLEDYAKQHALAARIMAARGHLVKALKHALQGNNEDLFVEIFENFGGLTIWLHEGMGRLTEAVKLFRPHMNLTYPRLGLAECIVLIKQARLTDAEKLLKRLIEATDNFTQNCSSSSPEGIALDHNFVRSMMTVYGCKDLNIQKVTSLLADDVNGEGEEEIVLGHNKTLLCALYAQKAEFAAARVAGHEAIDHFRNASSEYGVLFIDFHLGSVEMAAGRAQRAVKHYDKARRVAKQQFPTDPGPKLIGDILSFELAVERNEQTGMNSRLNNILNKLHTNEAWLDIYMAAYVAVGRYLQRVNGLDKLEHFLDDGLEYASGMGIRRLRDVILLVKAEALLVHDKIDEADELLAMCNLPLDDLSKVTLEAFSWREIELIATVSIMADIARQKYDQALQKSVLFDQYAHKADLIRSLVKASALISVIHIHHERWDHAANQLHGIAGYLTQNQYYNLFLNYHDDFARLKEVMADEEFSLEFEELYNSIDSLKSANDDIAFSDRERTVIGYLREGLQDKQIARKIGFSEHAVRYHLKKIYQKVHAANRTEAIRNIDQILKTTNISS